MESSGHTGDKAMQTRNQQISDLFRDHHATLARRVAKQANVPAATIEDACSFAWTQLVARTDVRLDKTWEVLGWLTKTAVREAWQQARRSTGTEELDTTGVEGTARGLRAYDDVEQTVIGRDRLRSLAATRELPGLTERQRKMLLLHAIGFTYAEISEITGATLRTVDRQIYRAHARARAIDTENA